VSGSGGCGFGARKCSRLLDVQQAIVMFVCLNSFVMEVGFFLGSGGGGWVDFWGRIGKALLWVVFSSCWYSVGCS
jgi:hypothetical protein